LLEGVRKCENGHSVRLFFRGKRGSWRDGNLRRLSAPAPSDVRLLAAAPPLPSALPDAARSSSAAAFCNSHRHKYAAS
jgi:hypothetical protein